MASNRIRIVVKPTAGGSKIEKDDVDTSQTVRELKELLAEPSSIPADDQRLIYKGQILKDDRTLETYGIGNDHVLHLVRGKPAGSTQSAAGASASVPSAASAASGAATVGSTAGAIPHPLGGMVSPEVMQQMMNSPLMQQLLSNPEMMRNMLQMNPAVRELMDRDPQMAQLLNNPELLRDSMNLISNPNLMREYMRHNDRAISNIEALPGGFNALRQLYENVQEPLLNATTGPDANPFGSLLPQGTAAGTGSTGAGATGTSGGAAAGAADQPSSQPLPNPWALQGGAGAATGAGAASAGAAAAGRGGLDSLLSALGPAAPSGNVAEMTTRLLEDPAMRESMISMMSQPGMMDIIASSNPQLGQMLNTMPGIRETMQNPEMLRMMLNPDMLRMAMGMSQAMGGGAGAAGGAGGAPGAGAGMFNPAMLASMLGGGAAGGAGSGAATGGAGGGLDGLMGMLNSMQMGGLGGVGGFGIPPPVADPATTFASQIQQLQDMGFYDQEANIRALQATGGNVNAAVDRLLQGFP